MTKDDCLRGVHEGLMSENGLHCRTCGNQLMVPVGGKMVRMADVPAAELTEAKLRLGHWLSAEPGRSWDSETEGVVEPVEWTVELFSVFEPRHFVGSGPDLASAIIAALEAVNA